MVSFPTQYDRALGNARASEEFFGTANVERLHDALVRAVHARTGGKAKIDRQSDEDLRALMLEVYDARLGLAQLNGMVVERASEIVLNNLASYLAYLDDMTRQARERSEVARVLERPQATREGNSTRSQSRPVF